MENLFSSRCCLLKYLKATVRLKQTAQAKESSVSAGMEWPVTNIAQVRKDHRRPHLSQMSNMLVCFSKEAGA